MNPLDQITTFLGETWEWLKTQGSILKGGWTAWIAGGGLTATLATLDWPFELIADGAEGLAEMASTLASQTYSLPAAGPMLAQINRVFPLNEILVMEGTLLSLYISCILIRWAKNWVPGL